LLAYLIIALYSFWGSQSATQTSLPINPSSEGEQWASSRRQPLCSLQPWLLLLTAIFMALTVAAQFTADFATNSQDAQTIDNLATRQF